jgi:hypothetical protein
MATLPFVSVVGGFGRLFSAAKKFCLDKDIDTIKSYCDNRYASSVPVYELLGFKFLVESRYTPHYVKDGVRYRNQSLRKTKNERSLNKTEWELRSQEYDRIWDCGHKTYLYRIT